MDNGRGSGKSGVTVGESPSISNSIFSFCLPFRLNVRKTRLVSDGLQENGSRVHDAVKLVDVLIQFNRWQLI